MRNHRIKSLEDSESHEEKYFRREKILDKFGVFFKVHPVILQRASEILSSHRSL